MASNDKLDRWTFSRGANNFFHIYPGEASAVPGSDNGGSFSCPVFSPFGRNGT